MSESKNPRVYWGRRESGRALRASARTGALAVCCLACALTGCDRLDRDKKPYTPFGIATVAGPPSASAVQPTAPSEPAFEPIPFEQAPAKALAWEFHGRKLQAPRGSFFSLALAMRPESANGSNTDEAPDVLAWVEPNERRPTVPAGELWLYPANGVNRRISQIPHYLPSSPDCELTTVLTQTGNSTVTMDVSAKCQARLVPGSPTRGIEVLAPRRDEPHLMGLRLASAPAGETIEVTLDTTDRDGDGRDDVELAVRLYTRHPDHAATTRLAWFDRAAGLARDTEPTQMQFQEQAARALSRSENKSSRELALSGIDNLRRLYSASCAEGGNARLSDDEGRAFECGELSETLTRLVRAEVQSYLAAEDALGAIGALERSAWFAPALQDGERQQLLQRVSQLVDTKRVPAPRVVPVMPRESGSVPTFSPLYFDEVEGGNRLLVETPTELVALERVGLGFEIRDVSEEENRWPAVVISAKGHRWLGIAFSCERSEVVLVRTRSDGGLLSEQVTPLLSPRPSSCSKAGYEPHLPATPVGFGLDGEQVIAYLGASRLFEPSESPGREPPMPGPVQGGPRSANGEYLVLPTELGLWVQGKGRPAIWVPEGQPSAAAEELLEACVIANDGRSVACMRGSTPLWFDGG